MQIRFVASLNGFRRARGAAMPRRCWRSLRAQTAINVRGIDYNRKGQHDRASADFDEAIRLDPKFALVHYNRGWAYNSKGNYDRAIADFNEAIRLDPKDAAAYSNRGAAYYGKGAAPA
jgi:tetratricopeptide (TPR) repeat protein